MLPDLRDAFRALRATPVVTAVAILSLALGIGANTAIFSILNSLVLKSLPVKEPDRLVQITIGPRQGSWTNPQWEQIRDRSEEMFDGAFVWSSPRFDVASGGQTEFVNGLYVSGRYFETLGVPAILGRTLTPDDDRRGGGTAGPVAVISYSFWQRRYGGAADVVGKPLSLDRVPFTIVGVTLPEFTGIEPGRAFDVAIPLGAEPLIRGKESFLDRRSTWWISMMARLKPGQTLEAAQQALRGIQPQVREATFPPNYRPENAARYLAEGFTLRHAANGPSSLRNRYQQPLVAILIVVALVLLIACANIANLLLARATARRHELSVRLALGASRWRLARQLLMESLLLSGTGAAAGLLFALWGSRLLVGQLSTATNIVFLNLNIDWRVLVFTLSVTVITAVLFGTAPALRASGVQPNEGLKEQSRAIAGEPRFGLGSLLVAGQVALSLILIVAAGLFIRTFVSLSRTNLGFDVDPILLVTLNTQRVPASAEQRIGLYEQARQAVLVLPGVQAAGLSAMTPISGGIWNTLLENPEGLALSERDRESYVNEISPGWLTTYGIPLVAGRDFTDADRRGAPHVILVNETFARKFFPGKNPLGQRVREVGDPVRKPPEREIAGVVRDAVYNSLRQAPPPTMYQAAAQSEETGGPGATTVNLNVRVASGSPALLTRSVVEAIGRINKDITLTFRPLATNVQASTNQERLVALLSGFFGALALLLAAVGLYGVMSYNVSRRRAEIGIRMALGAAPAGVISLVLKRVALLVGSGLVIGAAASLWAAKFVTPLIFGLQPRDPVTLAGAVVVLSVIGAFAGWLPARRAARIDPAMVLRQG
jgi:putative ABC transport system permease protein